MRRGKRKLKKTGSKARSRAARKSPARAAKRTKRARPARRMRTAARKPRGAGKSQAARKVAGRKAARPRPKRESPRVQKLRAMLEAKSAEILEKIRRAREESVDTDRTSFAEVGDLVSASVEKEKAFESGEAGVNAMREIATALERLKGGTYGACERCGKPIGFKRLQAMPSARLCVKCKTREEAKGKVAPPPADSIFED
ncbi:MAG TPA: TraR/DksA C4-type zinc finger protein [bacterium]|nr:TraR/DksA C4-type zinc finger protein [bacterium]